MPFNLTESAANRIKQLLAEDSSKGIDISNMMLRITVTAGGCSGFQYNFDFDKTANPEDIISEAFGAKVVIDDVSLGFVDGSELDFIETLGESSFKISNPNATAKCGCGNSFAA